MTSFTMNRTPMFGESDNSDSRDKPPKNGKHFLLMSFTAAALFITMNNNGPFSFGANKKEKATEKKETSMNDVSPRTQIQIYLDTEKDGYQFKYDLLESQAAFFDEGTDEREEMDSTLSTIAAQMAWLEQVDSLLTHDAKFSKKQAVEDISDKVLKRNNTFKGALDMAAATPMP